MKSLIDIVGGVPFLLVVLAQVMGLVLAGTLAQAHMPLDVVQKMYFHAPLLWLGGFVPLPGLPLLLAGLLCSLLVQLARQKVTPKNVGVWLVHAGVVALIISSLVTLLGTRYGYVALREGEVSSLWLEDGADEVPVGQWKVQGVLPFSLELRDFSRRNHPGTTTPAYFGSEVILRAPGQPPVHEKIEMNAPLRWQKFTAYQASYAVEADGREVAILSVVYDPGRAFPLLATALLALGFLVHVALNYVRRFKLAVVVALMLGAGQGAWAQSPAQQLWVEKLGEVAVQHQGRIKPLQAVAQVMMPEVDGRRYSADAAMARLAEVLLAETDFAHEVLTVREPAVHSRLGLQKRRDNAYSARELFEHLEPLRPQIEAWQNAKASTLGADEKAVLKLYDRLDELAALKHVFAPVKPVFAVDGAVARVLGVSPTTLTPLEVVARRAQIISALENPTTAPEVQLRLMQLMTTLRSMDSAMRSDVIGLAPLNLNTMPESTEWVGLWRLAFAKDAAAPDEGLAFKRWQAVQRAYALQRFDDPAVIARLHQLGHAQVRQSAVQVELVWARLAPVTLAFVPLLVALGLALSRWARLAYAGLAVAQALLSLGLLMRFYILQRPPVATLYESFLFVAWVVMAAALAFGFRRPLVVALGALMATVVLAMSHVLAQGAETMGMLTAVLNTNFWLTVHVLTISLGYATSLAVAGMGFLGLGLRVFGASVALRKKSYAVLQALVIVALFLSATGTLLGGVWATESWGRFWGWDPKENGALLLVIWLTMVAHLRFIKPLPYRWVYAAAGFTLVVLAFSWLGVNLLGVGLHSYGFISGVEKIFFSLVGLALATLAAAVWMDKLRVNKL